MGLVASFHGLILAASRATYEFGKAGCIPILFGKVHPTFKTPVNALLLNMCVGIAALFTGKTGDIITIACFGAITLYIFAMISVLVLRKKEPALLRPFRTPLYPWFPVIALLIASVSFIAMVSINSTVSMFFIGIMVLAYIWFILFVKKSSDANNSNLPG